jgi:Mg2+/Co2+ transporter CorC
MKITKFQRDSIVRAIMQDVPKPDKVKRRIAVQNAIVKAMSPEVRKVFKTTPGALRSSHVGDLIDTDTYNSRSIIVGDVTEKILEEILKPYKAEDEFAAIAKRDLRYAIDGCTTLKQLNDRLPEFKKYYPQASAPMSANLPALTNVVANLSKLGWPKK